MKRFELTFNVHAYATPTRGVGLGIAYVDRHWCVALPFVIVAVRVSR